MLTLQVGKLISISFILNTQDNLIVYHKFKKKKGLAYMQSTNGFPF